MKNFRTSFVQAAQDFSHSKKEEAKCPKERKGLIIMGIQQTEAGQAECHIDITGEEEILTVGFSEMLKNPVMSKIALSVLRNPKLNGGLRVVIFPPLYQGIPS